MQVNRSGTIALSVIIVGAIGAIVYFFFKKKNAKNGVTAASLTGSNSNNVAGKVNAGYQKSMQTMSTTTLKKYTGWLDEANNAAARFLNDKGSSPTIEGNLNPLTKTLPDSHFKHLVQYWKASGGISDLRDTNLMRALPNLIDPSYDAVNDFYARTVKVGISQ